MKKYGADIILSAKGTYKIRSKAVIGDKTLQEEFSYEVKSFMRLRQ